MPAVYGGSELRALRFLRGLSAYAAWRVSLIVFAESAGPIPGLDVEIIADRYPIGRQSFTERLTDLFMPASRLGAGPPVTHGEARAWRRADAALYVVFGVSDYAAKLATWCRRNGRRLVLVSGSDSDFDACYQPGDEGLNSYGSRYAFCRYAIDAADAFICQTRTQAALLAERFGRSSVVVRNPVELGTPFAGARRFALWLGKTDRVKRPELFRELANLCPEVPCVLIANVTDRARYDVLRQGAPGNLEVCEAVSRSELDQLLADSFCLVNTSLFEGFPNAFLDAGRQALPVLSLAVDPDGALTESGGGINAGGDLAALAASVRHLHNAPGEARQMGMRWRAHVEAHHQADTQIAAFAAALRQIAAMQANQAA
jgi:glycosyltransferase involved in cell wall biosynthesis